MKPGVIALLATLGLLSGVAPSAANAPNDPAPPEADAAFGKIRWVVRPNYMEANLIVGRLSRMNGPMTARLECVIGKNGFLKDCAVLEESPPNRGVAAAAIELSKKYKAASKTSTGVPTAGRHVIFPFHFAIKGSA